VVEPDRHGEGAREGRGRGGDERESDERAASARGSELRMVPSASLRTMHVPISSTRSQRVEGRSRGPGPRGVAGRIPGWCRGCGTPCRKERGRRDRRPPAKSGMRPRAVSLRASLARLSGGPATHSNQKEADSMSDSTHCVRLHRVLPVLLMR
jgi:hypothetical protein